MQYYKHIFISTFILMLFCNCHLAEGGQQNNVDSSKKDSVVAAPMLVNPNKDTISIAAVGDMMIGTAFPEGNLPPNDGAQSFSAVTPFLKGNIVFGNLEGCLLNQGISSKCKDPNSNSCFAFRMPERYIQHFLDAGFNVLSMANNHMNDFGDAGRARTIAILDSVQINTGGLEEKPYSIFKIGNITYGFIAFAPNEHTLSINDIAAAKERVSALKKQVHIVIVSFHGGGEGSKFEHVTRKKEIFYNENRGNVYEFTHAMIDAGADLLLGNGPHVTRAVEVYKHKFIAYSLGNFCTFGMFNLKGPNGIAPLLQLKLSTNGDFISAKVISIYQLKDQGMYLDKSNSAFDKIKELTQIDFAKDPSVKFTNNNEILPIN